MSQPSYDGNWEALIAALPVIITRLDSDFRVVRQFNAEKTPLQTQPGEDFLSEYADRLQQVADGHGSLQFEAAVSSEDTTWYRHHVELLPGDDGLVVSSIDITEQKEHEAELRHVKRRFNAILDNASDAIAISTAGNSYDDSVLLAGNQRLVKLTGYTLDELKTIRPSQVIADDLRSALEQRRQKRAERARPGVSEGMGKRKDGTIFPFESMAIRILDDSGNTSEWITFVRDISKRKEREQELLDARLQAETALKARDVFIANMSHELRSPLNTIQGHVQLAMEYPGLAPAFVEHLQAIDFSADYLNRLISDVLDLSRVEAGFDSLHPTTFDLPSLFNRLHGMMRVHAKRKRLNLTLDIAADLPPLIRMDEVKLKQVLINLIDNAIKYTHTGTITVQAGVIDHQVLRCTIVDTGPGISTEDMVRLLQPFERGTQFKQAISGSGLGLSISKRLVNLMGGALAIRHGEKQGTTVTIELPFEPVQMQATAQSERIPSIATHKTHTILIVDDQPADRLVLEAFLKMRGFVVETADNGLEALRMIEDHKPDMACIDLRMPGLDGAETVRRIREMEQGDDHLPVIAITADVLPENEQRMLEAGCDAVVFKPYRLARVGEVMARYLDIEIQFNTKTPLADKPGGTVTTYDLAVLPQDWLQQMYDISTAASHQEAIEHIRLIENGHPDLARQLRLLVRQFWTAHIADLIAPLLT